MARPCRSPGKRSFFFIFLPKKTFLKRFFPAVFQENTGNFGENNIL
jgi:hypothetical protein